MARGPPLLLLLLLLSSPPPVLVSPLLLPPGNASLPGCPPGRFQCAPSAACFPREWRCDGHPDCEDEGDEEGCGTATPAETSPDGAWVTPPWSPAVLPTGSAALPLRGGGGRRGVLGQTEPHSAGPASGFPRRRRRFNAQGSLGKPLGTSESLPALLSSSGPWGLLKPKEAPAAPLGSMWILDIAVLLSILVAVGSVAVWSMSKAKRRSDLFSLEKASREQLMPDESQAGSFL
ncbi:CD320 antigen [Leptosomus discolor]